MAGGKQTPRQRMMGILYLVLLGLVALNVPEGLLDAFKHIKESLETSTGNVQKDLDQTYSTFKSTTLQQQKARAQPILDTAEMATAAAQKLWSDIEALKVLLVKEGGGISDQTHDVDKRDNLDISPNIMIDNKKGEQLKQEILATKARLLSLVRAKDRPDMNLTLDAKDPAPTAGIKKEWAEAYFGDGIPLGATLATLAKIQTDTKNAENEVVRKILSYAEKAKVNLDQFNAVAVAPTSYVLEGQPYTADIFLTAYDSKLSPSITVNGSSMPVSEGKGKYSGDTRTDGLHTWHGVLSFKDNDGKLQTYNTPDMTYMVAKPSAVVSPDKMNVLYIGLPNPVSVSAPGIAAANLRVSISGSGGTISGSGEHWTAEVKETGTATVTVSGELTKGKVSALGSTTFRVKRIPDPKPMFAGKSGGNTSAANIRAQDRIFANLENFEFDAKFKVTRFTLIVVKPRQDAIIMSTNGNELTAAMHTAMSGISPGTTVIFKDVVAVGPDGTQRGLDPIVLSTNQ